MLRAMFDRWVDVYNERGIVGSHLMHSVVIGLSLNLSVCRRTLKDRPHFHRVAELYERQYFKPGMPVDQKALAKVLKRTLEEYTPKFPIYSDKDGRAAPPDKVAAMSHTDRLFMNALLNSCYAEKQSVKKWLPWTRGLLPGATMQPQSCNSSINILV